MITWLNDEDCEQLLPMSEAVEAVREVYRRAGQGDVALTPKQRAGASLPRLRNGITSVIAVSDGLDVMVSHVYTTGARDIDTVAPKKLYALFRRSTGDLCALMAGDHLSWAKTGAVGAVAAEALASPESRRVGVIGAGRQGKAAVAGLAEVLPIEQVAIYSRSPETRAAFVVELRAWAEQEGLTQLEVVAADTPQSAVRDADVVVTTTTSKTPVLEHGWLKPGVHINAIGSSAPTASEIDRETIAASRIFVDYREQAVTGKGEVVIALREGLVGDASELPELGDVLVEPGLRPDDGRMTLFCSGGVGLEALAVAWRSHELATASSDRDFSLHLR